MPRRSPQHTCAHPRRFRSTCLLQLFALASCISPPRPAHATPSFQPTSTINAASSFLEGQAMYVFGGFPSTAASTKATPQAFMLDLSVSWSADSPAFTRLPDGPVAPAQYGEITPDRQSWFTWLDGLGSVYDLKEATWSKVHLTAASNGKSSHTAGSDSGNALYSPNTDGSHKTIASIDLASKTYYTIPHPDSIYSIGYSLTWNAPLQSALFIGGTTGPLHRLDRLNLFLYNSTTGWSNLNNTAAETTPPPRYGACVASAYGGSKVILFGGYGSDNSSALSDIYILDVATMTWTQGPNTAPKQGRGFAVCSASSNYFIAWGGASDSKNANALNSTLVYDLAANNWVSSYTYGSLQMASLLNETINNTTTTSTYPKSGAMQPSTTTTTLTATSSSIGPSPEQSVKLRIIVIIGAVLGALAFTAAVGVLAIYRSRRRLSQINSASAMEEKLRAGDQLQISEPLPQRLPDYKSQPWRSSPRPELPPKAATRSKRSHRESNSTNSHQSHPSHSSHNQDYQRYSYHSGHPRRPRPRLHTPEPARLSTQDVAYWVEANSYARPQVYERAPRVNDRPLRPRRPDHQDYTAPPQEPFVPVPGASRVLSTQKPLYDYAHHHHYSVRHQEELDYSSLQQQQQQQQHTPFYNYQDLHADIPESETPDPYSDRYYAPSTISRLSPARSETTFTTGTIRGPRGHAAYTSQQHQEQLQEQQKYSYRNR